MKIACLHLKKVCWHIRLHKNSLLMISVLKPAE